MSIEERLRIENQQLRDRIAVLERATGAVVVVPEWLGLTVTEGKLFAYLATRGVASREQIWDALHGTKIDGGPSIKVIDVVICKVRKKLRPHGLAISTRWGHGYALRAEHLERAREILGITGGAE